MEASSPADDRVAPGRLVLAVGLGGAAWLLTPGPDSLRAGMGLLVLVAGLWLTQAIPLAVTALAVPLLVSLAGIAPPRAALVAFADPVIFLFLGGFALAAALARQGLDQALAEAVLRLARGRRAAAVVLLAGLTALLSMWMSNTATVALMLPLALGLLGRPSAEAGAGRTEVFLLLAVAYSASIGGMATLVGSPPNAIAAAQAGISFTRWLAFGLPLALLLWPLMLLLLAWLLRPDLGGRVELSTTPFRWNGPRLRTAVIFGLAVAGWVFGAPLSAALGLGRDSDTVVALLAILALVATGCLAWNDLERQVQWGVLILFGGGIALGEALSASGVSGYLARGLLGWTEGAPALLLLLALLLFAVLLTELVSNTASTALLVPLFLPLAPALGLPPAALAAAIAAASSCGFMLPVATPPNAMVYGTGRVPQALMVRCGFWLNLAGALAIAMAARWAWPA